MKTKLIITLIALLMLVGIGAQAQTDNQTPASTESTDLEGDLNHDGKVDVADVTYLVNLIMKNQSEAKDGTYYWYIGVDNPASISDIQADNTKPGWHEIGASLDGFVLDTNGGPQNEIELSSTERLPYYVIIPNELHIYNGLDINIESIGFTEETCNIAGYKSFKFKLRQGVTGVYTVAGIVIKEGTSKEPVNDNFYWYIGVDNPASISDIQTDNTKPGWHEIGESLDGFVLDATKTDNQVILNTENVKYYYYVVIPDDLHIYESSNTSNVENIYFDPVECNIAGYKAFQYKVDPGTRTVKGIIIRESNEPINDNFYWYIGVDNPASISDIQSDNTKPGWHEIGTSLDGFVHDMNNRANWIKIVTKSNPTEDDMIPYYLIVPNGISIVNALGTDLTTNGQLISINCSISGYKAFVSRDGFITVKGLIIKEGTSDEPIKDNFYWYIGVDNPASISDIQSDNTKPGWHEIGASLAGFELDTNDNRIALSTERVIYYVIIPNDLHIYNGFNQIVDSIDYISQECNINGYKSLKIIPDPDFPDGVRYVQGPIIKE